MCEDGAGQFIQARQRIGSTVVSLLVIIFAGLRTFLRVMHLKLGYNKNIFLCHGAKECVRKQQPSAIHE